MKQPPPLPPRLAEWILCRCVHEVDGWAIVGDLEETYRFLYGHYGAGPARRWYWGQVLRSAPTLVYRSLYWSILMLRNYLKIAQRNLIKNGWYTVINITGLAVALACCIVAYLNYDFSYSFDAFHEKGDHIYRVNSIKTVNGREQRWGISPMPLGPALAKDVPFVEKTVRLTPANGVFRYGDTVLNELVTFVDDNFFDVFTFPLKAGRPEALQDPSQLIISEDVARKYFGEADPIGQEVILQLGQEKDLAFVVGGVTENVPDNSSIFINILLSYSNIKYLVGEDLEDWGRWGQITFLELTDPSQAASLDAYMQPYLELQNAARPDWLIDRFYYDALPEMAFTERETIAYILRDWIHPAAIMAPTIIAVLLLLMACFNFMNTAIAYAGKRLKEIGVRKVVGGIRHQLIGQFMGESLLLCALAFVLSLLLAEIFVPAYSNLWTYMDLSLNYADNIDFLLFLGMLLVATALIAGGYPALYISSFNPITILTGRQQLGGANVFTRSLLTFQFSIAVLVIIASLAFSQNARYQENLDLGYDRETVIGVRLDEAETFTPYRDAIVQHPDVESVAGSRGHLGYSWYERPAESEGTQTDAHIYRVGDHYVETMGLHLRQGRSFDALLETDQTESVLVNETLIRDLGWGDPIGRFVTIDSVRYSVIGVVADFYNEGVWDPIQATVLRLNLPEQHAYVTVKVRGQNMVAVNDFLEETWHRIVPGVPYSGFYQDEVLGEAMQINNSIVTLFYYIALIAIVIAVVGLFALVSLNIARRTKEVGIRKVLGASVVDIGYLINKEFILLLVVASTLASVAGYFVIDLLMDSIWAYNAGVGVVPLLVATVLIFVIAALAVAGQVYRIATSNPVSALRYE